jgi:PAS domain S-box-containing protein
MNSHPSSRAPHPSAEIHRYLFAQAMEVSHDLAFVVDLEGRFTYLNGAAGELFGKRPEEVMGRFLWDVIPDAQQIAVIMEATLAYGQWGGEITCERVGVSPVPVRIRTVLIQSKEGELLGIVGMGWDTSKQREMESQMVASERQRLLGQIADGVAHDLNNSLAGILGYAELLVGLKDLPEKAREYAGIIEAAAERSAELVARIHRTARGGEGGPHKAVDLNALARASVSASEPKWRTEAWSEGRAIEVDMLLEAGRTVDGLASEIDEVVTNLIFNSVDAMPDGGRITIKTWDEGQWVCLSVADTGIGMDRQSVRRMGEMFFTTKGAKGHGVGVAVCYRLVEGMSGQVAVDSAPGEGTVFTIRLPEGTLLPEAQEECPAPAPENLNVLVIDDDEQILSLIDMALGQCHVTSAPDGEAGLEAFEAGSWDVILVDLTMPGLNGLQVGSRIRLLDPDVPLVLMTGWKRPADEGVSVFSAVLPKPFSLAEMKRCLAEVTG